MNIAVTINSNSTILRINMLTAGWAPVQGNTVKLHIAGEATGVIVPYVITGTELTELEAGFVLLDIGDITSVPNDYLKDDFYSVTLKEYQTTTTTVVDSSPVKTLMTYATIQQKIYTKLIGTERLVGAPTLTRNHELIMQLRALEILGHNPSVLMKDTFRKRILYLNAILQ